jgi:hypothetical protein
MSGAGTGNDVAPLGFQGEHISGRDAASRMAIGQEVTANAHAEFRGL